MVYFWTELLVYFSIEINIDWSYKTEIDINQVWAQAYNLFITDFNYNLTWEELQTNEERNKRFQKLTVERELLQKLFDPDNERNPNNFMTATDVMLKIKDLSNVGNQISKENIGRALKQLRYPEGRDTHSRYGYFVYQKSFINADSPF